MISYLKNICGAIFIATFFAVPAQADPELPAPIPGDPAQAAPAPAGAAQADSTQAPVQTGPVQTDTVQTDHAQKPKDAVYYSYAHDEAEYSVSLPEAPTVTTIWQESPETKPYLKLPPTDHAELGEMATFKLVDMDTEEVFDVKILFLRASPAFLEGLTDEKIKHMLMKKFSEVALSNETFDIADGTGTLKWARLTGFVLDAHHHPAFYALHYLTGLQSILVIHVKYSIENKTFQEYYNHMVSSVTYVQP